MDVVSGCRDKLMSLRIKELKAILDQLNLVKKGKKQDLVNRILPVLLNERDTGGTKHPGKEEIAKIIGDAYRKMQVPGGIILTTKSHSGSNFGHKKIEEEPDESYQNNQRVRCICGSSVTTESMLQCQDPRCQVWQHFACVVIPENPMEVVSPKDPFYCELCRLARADPFWLTVSHPLQPIKFMSSGVSPDGTNKAQSVERMFQMSEADWGAIQTTECDVQVWCMLLNDKAQFRMQWPQNVDLQINGSQVRVIARPGAQQLGINGRDDVAVITKKSTEGSNTICLTRGDSRTFCFGIRIAKQQTVQQVLSLVPNEANGECFEDALARVRRCVRCDDFNENVGSESDLEVVAESVTVNLRCPMSGSRIKVAGRFKPCRHMGCFDLNTFVELNQLSRKWQCPICLKNYSYEHVIIDPYFNRITTLLRFSGEDVDEIEVKPDGSWRIKREDGSKESAQWHFPDGSVFPMKEDRKTESGSTKRLNQGELSEEISSLRTGIKRSLNESWAHWAVKPVDERPSIPDLHVPAIFGNNDHSVHVRSSSNGLRDGEDAVVNNGGGVHFDLSLNTGHDFDSVPMSFDQLYSFEDRVPLPLKDQDIIVLSDSDEDNPGIPPAHADGGAYHFPVSHALFPERYPEQLDIGSSEILSLDFFKKGERNFEINHWPVDSSQPGSGFHLFSTDNDIPDAMGVQLHDPGNVLPVADFGCGPFGDAYECQTNGTHGGLVDNLFAFECSGPSLQNFLPTGPLQPDLNRPTTDAARGDDWISLSLGAGVYDKAISTPNLQQQPPQKAARVEILSDSAPALLGINENEQHRGIAEASTNGSIFSPPRQP